MYIHIHTYKSIYVCIQYIVRECMHICVSKYVYVCTPRESARERERETDLSLLLFSALLDGVSGSVRREPLLTPPHLPSEGRISSLTQGSECRVTRCEGDGRMSRTGLEVSIKAPRFAKMARTALRATRQVRNLLLLAPFLGHQSTLQVQPSD